MERRKKLELRNRVINLGTPYRGKKEYNFLLTCLPAGREAEAMDLANLHKETL
jgi:hypothetical protein